MSDYSDWLNTQSKTFQNRALGQKRAERFREGEAIAQYVEYGKPLTLKELNDTNDISINGE